MLEDPEKQPAITNTASPQLIPDAEPVEACAIPSDEQIAPPTSEPNYLRDSLPYPVYVAFVWFAIVVDIVYNLVMWTVIAVVFIGGIGRLVLSVTMVVAPLPTVLALVILVPTVIFFAGRAAVHSTRKLWEELKKVPASLAK